MGFKIVVDKDIPYIKGVFEPFATVVYEKGININNDIVKDADALVIRTRTKCNKNLLDNSGVKFIGTATIGTDHIDIDYCNTNDIYFTNAIGCNSGSVYQYVTRALFYLSLKFNFNLRDKVIGIVGVGNIGKKIEAFCKILGITCLCCDPPRERNEVETGFVSLETIQKKADIITLHTPLIKEGEDKTFHLINSQFLSGLTKEAIVINTSRGEVVDTECILKSTITRGVSAVVLDVWENEPLINKELLNKTIIATPHIAGYSADGKAKGTEMIVRELAHFFGLPLTNWEPKELLSVQNQEEIKLNNGDDLFSKLNAAISHTYNIELESNALKRNPDRFEQFRAEYAVRREFSYYKISGLHLNKEEKEVFKKVGFTVE